MKKGDGGAVEEGSEGKGGGRRGREEGERGN